MVPKNNKYLRINLTTYLKDLYHETYVTYNSEEKKLYLCIKIINIFRMSTYSKHYRDIMQLLSKLFR